MEYSKEQQTRKPKKKLCKVINCGRVAGDPKYKGLCFKHRGILQKIGSPVKKGPKRDSLSKWKKKVDSVFSVFIRLRDTNDQGVGRCISSGKMIYYYVNNETPAKVVSNCDNGHFENRALMSLRYDEFNCNAQLRHDNRFKEGMKNDYERGMVKKWGQSITDNVKRTAKVGDGIRRDVLYLQALYSHYEKEVSVLLTKKEWWNKQRTQKSLYK